jgi:rhodanese-related sulfurtransferase
MSFPLVFLLLAGAFMAWTFWRARPEVGPEDLRGALKSGDARLVDVREPAEWATGTAKHAALLPLSDLRGSRQLWNEFLAQNRDKQLLVYCQSGSRSAMVAAQLRREGIDACNAGSLAALDRAGWPVCRRRT